MYDKLLDLRRPIEEGIAWKDADGRTFQTWDVYESVRNERDTLRKALAIATDALRRGADDHHCDYCRADLAAVRRAMGDD